MVRRWSGNRSGNVNGGGISAGTSDPALDNHRDTLRAFVSIIRDIAAHPLIHSDAYAQRIIHSIAKCTTPIEADELMDKLLVRVGEIIAARTGDNSELHHLMALTGARRRAPMNMHSHRPVEDDALPSRTFMKL